MEQIPYKPADDGKKIFILMGAAIKLMDTGIMLLDHLRYIFQFTGVPPPSFSMAGRFTA